MSQEYTYQDVAEHNTKKDLFVVVHDKVYSLSNFVDEHPYVLPDRFTPPFFFLDPSDKRREIEMRVFAK